MCPLIPKNKLCLTLLFKYISVTCFFFVVNAILGTLYIEEFFNLCSHIKRSYNYLPINSDVENKTCMQFFFVQT